MIFLSAVFDFVFATGFFDMFFNFVWSEAVLGFALHLVAFWPKLHNILCSEGFLFLTKLIV